MTAILDFRSTFTGSAFTGSAFTGAVHRPGDPGYDAQRAAFRPSIDSRPELIVEAAGEHDVALAVRTARERGLGVTVQGTGHGTIEPAHGLLLRTGGLGGVTVDPRRRVARAGAGVRWGAVVAAAAPYGLAPLSGTSFDVGVAGYTFGGGLSWRSRRHGYAADSLLRVRAVTADGDVVVASPEQHADLFWALRGGGGAYAVVTELEFRLYPADGLYGGKAYYPIERSRDVLAFYADWAATQPDELTTTVALAPAPSGTGQAGTGRAVAVRAVGKGMAAERALGELRRVAGPAVGGGFGPITYDDIPGIGDTRPLRFERVRSLPDGLVDLLVDQAGPDAQPGAAAEVRFWGGAMARPQAGPIGHRDVPFSVILDGPPAGDAAIDAYATGGAFLNFLSDTTRTHAAFTASGYERLRRIKRAYDPTGLFATGHTVLDR